MFPVGKTRALKGNLEGEKREVKILLFQVHCKKCVQRSSSVKAGNLKKKQLNTVEQQMFSSTVHLIS